MYKMYLVSSAVTTVMIVVDKDDTIIDCSPEISHHLGHFAGDIRVSLGERCDYTLVGTRKGKYKYDTPTRP